MKIKPCYLVVERTDLLLALSGQEERVHLLLQRVVLQHSTQATSHTTVHKQNVKHITTSHIPNVTHTKRHTYQTSHTTVHKQNVTHHGSQTKCQTHHHITHTKRHTYQTSHIPNVTHTKRHTPRFTNKIHFFFFFLWGRN